MILGSGYDCRAYRLEALSDRIVYEVDHPRTLARKRRVLQRAGVVARPTIRFVGCDFEADDLVTLVTHHGFDVSQRSVILWEGVTNDLTAAGVDATFAALRRLATTSSVLVFTYVDERALDRTGTVVFPEAARWIGSVAHAGEPWTFGLLPVEVDEFLRARGFDLTVDRSTADLTPTYFRARGRREVGSSLYRIAVARRR